MRNAELEARWTRRLLRAGEFLESLDEGRGLTGLKDAVLDEVRMQYRGGVGGEVFLIVKAHTPAGEHVAFCGALGGIDAVLTWRGKDGKKGLKWRIDTPWEPGE